MRVLMAACSVQSYKLMQELGQKLRLSYPDITIITKVKCRSLAAVSEKISLTECVGKWFYQVDAILFLCAAGIAVRSIAPYIRHKSTDPAVIVIDETGKFCIPLLSGHAGGGNELAEQIAEMLGAVPVITTATDREHKFAVDDFARKNQLVITDWKMAKEISVRILEGEKVGICSEIPIEGEVPEELKAYSHKDMEKLPLKEKAGILISFRREVTLPFDKTLQLIPKRLAVGIGCRKNTPEGKISDAVEQCLVEGNLMPEALAEAASIDLKKWEKGLLAFCERREIPFLTYSAEILSGQPGEFTESDFVRQTTGVSNVCERSAVAAAQGPLICKKKIYHGVTIALAEKKGSVIF